MTEWLSIVISTLALVITGLSYQRDRRSSRDSAASAERSAQRADEAVAAQKRMAEALEAQVPAAVVKWSLTFHQGSAYLLTNTGDLTATDVHIDPGHDALTPGELDVDVMRPREPHKFMASTGIGRAHAVTVTWTDSRHKDLLTWRTPLPPPR